MNPIERRPGPVVIDVEGLDLNAADRARIQHPLTGGVILFARNFESREQVRTLCAQIRSLRTPAPLICVDHEGGRVQRFRTGFTRIEPMRAVGELWDKDPLAVCARAT